MKITDKLKQAQGETLFSFEILPPKKGQNLQSLLKNIEPLLEFNPAYINVTYHREEHEYVPREGGLLEKKVTRRRPGTVGLCAVIQNKYGVDAVPHVICGSFSQEDTENFLIDLDFIGIENVMALRGDAIKSETYFTPTSGGHRFANELVQQIANLNQGKYLADDLQGAYQTNFEIGVAGYPEKHMEAPSLKQDIQHLKKKVDAGASYIVTQMFYDNQKYFDFVAQCRAAGITVPIIPGLKPLTILRHLNILPQHFKVDLPDDLVNEVMRCKNNKDAMEVGIQWCIQQSKELKAAGVPALHYFTMGKSNATQRVLNDVF